MIWIDEATRIWLAISAVAKGLDTLREDFEKLKKEQEAKGE